jgi:hypothetical protein
MTLTIRPITRDDADIVTAMAREASQYLIDLGDKVTFQLTRERFLVRTQSGLCRFRRLQWREPGRLPAVLHGL